MLVDGHECARLPRQQLFRQILRHFHLPMMQNIVLHRFSGQLHIRVFLRPLFSKPQGSPLKILLQEVPALILFTGIEGADSVSDAGHILMRKLRGLHSQSVKDTCHNDK